MGILMNISTKLQARKAHLLQDKDALDQAVEQNQLELETVNNLIAGTNQILAEKEYIELHSALVVE